MWIVCITSVRHVLTVNGYGGRQTKENEKSWCFKGWETLGGYFVVYQCFFFVKSGQTIVFMRNKYTFQSYCHVSCILLVGAG